MLAQCYQSLSRYSAYINHYTVSIPENRMRKLLPCEQSWILGINFNLVLWEALGSAKKPSGLGVWDLLTWFFFFPLFFFLPSGLNLSCSLFYSLLCALFSPSWDISMSAWIQRTYEKRKRRQRPQAEETWLVSLLRKQSSNTSWVGIFFFLYFFFNWVGGRVKEKWGPCYFIL